MTFLSRLKRSFSHLCLPGIVGGVFLLGTSMVVPQIALAQSETTEEETIELRAAIANESDQFLVNTLIKSTLLALNHANQTENYDVLHSLASAEFQEKNTTADLFTSFQAIRETGLDFSGIVEFQPVFTVPPFLDPANNLRVIGYFDTAPIIEFDLFFLLEDGRFVIDSLVIGIRQANTENPSVEGN